jgi:serine/threonine-protein kinase
MWTEWGWVMRLGDTEGQEERLAGPDDEETGTVDTQAATAFGPQIAGQAWSIEEPDTEPQVTHSWRSTWKWAVGIAAVPVSAVVAVGVWTGTAAPAVTPAIPAHVLNGVYRLDFDLANQTVMGSPNPTNQKPESSWRAFRSKCVSNGCTAVSVPVDSANHQIVDTASTAGSTTEWQWVGDHWQSQPKKLRMDVECPNSESRPLECADEKTRVLQETVVVVTSLQPQPDGTLKGAQTRTTVTNDTERIGRVGQVPVLATRSTDVGPPVPDPINTATPPTPTVAPGPTLNGIYRINFDGSENRVTFNGVRQPSAEASIVTESGTWAFQSLCTPTGCVATSTQVDDSNNGEATAQSVVYHFTDNHWQGSQTAMLVQGWRRCGVTGQADTEINMEIQPQPNGTITGTKTVTITDSFCGPGKTILSYSFTAVQLAATIPRTVVLADPALFAT